MRPTSIQFIIVALADDIMSETKLVGTVDRPNVEGQFGYFKEVLENRIAEGHKRRKRFA